MRFTRDAFLILTPAARQERARELASSLADRLREAEDFDTEIKGVIESLRQQGHDLWNWDWDDDQQIWGPDYMKERLRGLAVHFDAPDEVQAYWIEDSDPTTVRLAFGGEGSRL